MSLPAKNTRPSSAARNPQTRLNRVVLPAPFGPMIACSRRGASARLTWSTATRPPKRLVSPSMRRTGSLMAGDPGEHAADDEGGEPKHVDVQPDQRGARVVLAYRGQRAPERACGQSAHQEEA